MRSFSRPCHPRDQVIVAIPLKDEAERIGACLLALAAQRGAVLDAAVLLVNNTSDGSATIARALTDALPFTLHVVERVLPPALASAGEARRAAMEIASAMAGEGGVLLSTDADGCVTPDWLALNLANLERGAEAVAGRVTLFPAEAAQIPDRLHEDDARECAYAAMLDEITSLLDPDPWDPWPRHGEHAGASICVTREAYLRAGGMPAVPLGEDRAFFGALRSVDARVRHAPEVRVEVSGRVHGRAPGGMADTIQRRLQQPDAWLDDALEPAATAALRARLRHRARRLHGVALPAAANLGTLAAELVMSRSDVEAALGKPYFGQAWREIETASPALGRTRVAVCRLDVEMEAALRERDRLRASAGGALTSPERAAAAMPA